LSYGQGARHLYSIKLALLKGKPTLT